MTDTIKVVRAPSPDGEIFIAAISRQGVGGRWNAHSVWSEAAAVKKAYRKMNRELRRRAKEGL